MANLSFIEIYSKAFQACPRNESYSTPGLYDLELEDSGLMLFATIIVMTTRTGWAMLHSGIGSTKNSVNALMKNYIDLCFGGTVFWMLGYAFMFGRSEYTNPFIALGDFFVNPKVDDPLFANIFASLFFRMSFATISTTIASGSCSERFNTKAYIIFSSIHVLVFSIGTGWVWGEHGFLKNIGVVDYAGAGPIHIIGGASALCATLFIGPRTGRYENKGTRQLQMGNGLIACIGLLILWWGSFGYSAASSYGISGGKFGYATRSAVGITVGSFSTGAILMWFSMWRYKGKIDVYDTILGIVTTFAVSNGGSAFYSIPISILVCIIGAILALNAVQIFNKLHIDDPVGACSVHLVGGIWGHICVGLFAQDTTPLQWTNGRAGLFMGGGFFMLLAQLISVICLVAWAMTATFIILWIINKFVPVRLSLEAEIIGCDIIDHHIEFECPLRPTKNSRELSALEHGRVSGFDVVSNTNSNAPHKEFESPKVFRSNLDYRMPS